MRNNLEDLSANRLNLLEEMEGKSFDLSQKAKRTKNMASLLATNNLPEYVPASFELDNNLLEKAALKYRSGLLDPDLPFSINENLENYLGPENSVALYDRLRNYGKDIPRSAIKNTQTKLKDLLKSDISIVPNRAQIMKELYKKDSGLAKEMDKLLAGREYIFPNDIRDLGFIAQANGKSFDIAKFPTIEREMELFGANELLSPFRNVQKNLGSGLLSSALDVTRPISEPIINTGKQISDMISSELPESPPDTEELLKSLWKGEKQNLLQNYTGEDIDYLRELGNQRVNKNYDWFENTLINRLNRNKQGLGDKFKAEILSKDRPTAIKNWLNNPNVFEKDPFGEYNYNSRIANFNRPVFDELLTKSNIPNNGKEDLALALLDVAKENNYTNIEDVLKRASESPLELRNKLTNINPETTWRNTMPSEMRNILSDMSINASNLRPAQKANWASISAPNVLDMDNQNPELLDAYFDGEYRNILNNPEQNLNELNRFFTGEKGGENLNTFLSKGEVPKIKDPHLFDVASEDSFVTTLENPLNETLSESFHTANNDTEALLRNQEADEVLGMMGKPTAEAEIALGKGGKSLLGKAGSLFGKLGDAQLVADAVKMQGNILRDYNERYSGGEGAVNAFGNTALDAAKSVTHQGASFLDSLNYLNPFGGTLSQPNIYQDIASKIMGGNKVTSNQSTNFTSMLPYQDPYAVSNRQNSGNSIIDWGKDLVNSYTAAYTGNEIYPNNQTDNKSTQDINPNTMQISAQTPYQQINAMPQNTVAQVPNLGYPDQIQNMSSVPKLQQLSGNNIVKQNKNFTLLSNKK